MASKSEAIVLLDVTLAPGVSGTKGAPGAVTPGGFFNNIGRYNSALGITIKNGGIAPGSPATVYVQVADSDVGPWTDYETVTGDAAAYNASTLAGLTTRTIILEKVRYVRVIAYGNTSQDVEVKARLHSVTEL